LWCSSSTPFIASLAKPGEYAIEASAFITAKCTFLSSSYNSICPEVPTLIGEMLPQFTGQAHTLSISSIVAYMCIYKGQYYDIYLHNLITIRCWTPEEGDGDTHIYYIYIISKLQNNYIHIYRYTWIDIWIYIFIYIYI
jgi:hypothetical protein